jgi:hypothetical protein
MIKLQLAAFALVACAQTAASAGPDDPARASPLVQEIRADLERLDRELAAPGIATAGIDEVADLGGGLTVRPLAVSDERCPRGPVSCVWEGFLRVDAEVAGEQHELRLGGSLATPRGTVVFAVAKPSKWLDWPTAELPRPAYRFGFRRE